jgi:hypothetical protein
MKLLISLLAAVTTVVMFALPGFAQSPSYTWQLNCQKIPALGVGVGTGVNWCWLHNGLPVVCSESAPNGFAACVDTPLSGTELVPETVSVNGIDMEANQIQVSLNIGSSPAGCQAFATATKSFDPSNPKISINQTVSIPATVKSFGVKEVCQNANASMSFSLQAQ